MRHETIFEVKHNVSLPVVHSVGGLVIGVNGIFVAELLGSLPLLMHVSPSHQFGSKVPTLTAGQFNVRADGVESFLQFDSNI